MSCVLCFVYTLQFRAWETHLIFFAFNYDEEVLYFSQGGTGNINLVLSERNLFGSYVT